MVDVLFADFMDAQDPSRVFISGFPANRAVAKQ